MCYVVQWGVGAIQISTKVHSPTLFMLRGGGGGVSNFQKTA